jgi:hypothetical protein
MLKRSLPLRNCLVSVSLALMCATASSSVSSLKAARQTTTANSQAAARTPNLSGIWMERETRNAFTEQEPPMRPQTQANYNAAKPGYGPRASAQSQDPILSCLPPGIPRIMLIPFPIQIVQTPGLIVMIFEYDHFVRQIYMDRREHPKDLELTWMGDSIGRWENDTLVVDTIGLNDKTWLDQVGHPHSDALHVVERIHRPDHDTLVDDITIDDPKAYTKPWTGQQIYKLKPNWHLIEYVCEDMGSGK